MRGDFSNWRFDPATNFNGVLPQQGKVSLDADGIAQTALSERWRQRAARDFIGPVAAVAETDPDSFNIESAVFNAGTVTLTVDPGHIWADGLLVYLGGSAPVTRTATWLEPPLVPNAGGDTNGTDVVVLEVWQEAINGYQVPDQLIEPALGGPDTAERLSTGFNFKLVRMNDGQTCKDLAFDESGLGRLKASLVPATVTTGDCPVPDGGGYSGLEHRLYRIEIADVNSGLPSAFKWSRMNGGLVGRGAFDTATNEITITANLTAISSLNQPTFYGEIEQWDNDLGRWTTVCGGNVGLLNGVLTFAGATPTFGTYPSANGAVFFRLWDGLDQIADFQTQQPLEDGILLQFDPDGVGVYRPHDYWVFAVRAGGIDNPQTLVDHEQPLGIVYHRVALAEITWSGGTATLEDCRSTIHPLTRSCGCCTVEVGDGVNSFAEFTSINKAIDSLPAEGGEVCLLPGRYFEQVQILHRHNVILSGCGYLTRIADPSLAPDSTSSDTNPVVLIGASQNIELKNFVVESTDGHVGVLIEGVGSKLPKPSDRGAAMREFINIKGAKAIKCEDLTVIAFDQPAIFVDAGNTVSIQGCLVAMQSALRSRFTNTPAIFLSGTEIHCTDNWVGILSQALLPPIVTDDYDTRFVYEGFTTKVTVGIPSGIQIGGFSRDIYVQRNEIQGGSGNGITLGSLMTIDSKSGLRVGGYLGLDASGDNQGGDCGIIVVVPPTDGQNNPIVIEGRLVNIHIEWNRIRNMGMSGIAPVGFFDFRKTQEVVTVDGLYIVGNEISSCVRRSIDSVTEIESGILGYGGISLPDVIRVEIRDNEIVDTGASLSSPVCGIFILHGEQVEISRNQIRDQRTFRSSDASNASGFRGGIVIVMVTPIPAGSSFASVSGVEAYASYEKSRLYDPGPALVIQENVVDIPAGLSLSVCGLGSFSILGNQFATKAEVERAAVLSCGILVLNLGSPLEAPTPVSSAAQALVLLAGINEGATGWQSILADLSVRSSVIGSIASGPIEFANNHCTVYQGILGSAKKQVSVPSIFIWTMDDLGFQDNQCLHLYQESREEYVDVFLWGFTLRATGNRIQERLKENAISLGTIGFANITAFNICSNFIVSNTPAQYYALNM